MDMDSSPGFCTNDPTPAVSAASRRGSSRRAQLSLVCMMHNYGGKSLLRQLHARLSLNARSSAPKLMCFHDMRRSRAPLMPTSNDMRECRAKPTLRHCRAKPTLRLPYRPRFPTAIGTSGHAAA